jgi:hypothetical protein
LPFTSEYLVFQYEVIISIILPVVFCACDTSFLTLREEYRWKVFENRAPRNIFGPEREEVTGGL